MSTKALRELVDASLKLTLTADAEARVRAARAELEAIEKAARDVTAFIDWTVWGGPIPRHVAALDTDGIRLLRSIAKQEP